MDLKVYYQKIREIEQSLKDEYAVVVSEATPDGGKAGVRTEVTRYLAAKMIADGRARPASAAEVQEFLEQKAEAKKTADQLAAASRVQVTVVSESDLRALRSSPKPSKQ